MSPVRHPSGRRLLVLANPATPGAGVDTFWQRVVPQLQALGWNASLRFGHGADDEDRPWTLNGGSVRSCRRIVLSSPDTFDHVITSIPQSDVLWSALRSRHRGPAWTVYVHGQPFPSPSETGRAKAMLWRETWRRAALRADGLLAVSEAVADHIYELTGRRPTVIPAPIGSVPNARRNLGVPFAVGFVGRLAVEKDPMLFSAIARECGNDTEFHAYGDGPLRGALAAEGRVRLHGHVSSRDDIYKNLHVLAVTSQREGLSMASLEASSYSVIPIVATVGGLPETIHPELRELLCIPPGQRNQTATWAKRIEFLRVSPQRERIRHMQRDWVIKRFDARSIGRRLDAHLLGNEGRS